MKESYTGKINRKLQKKLRIVDVAAGRQKADLVLKNARYLNVFSNEFCIGDIAVAEGLVVGMGEYSGINEVDVSGKLVLPGLIDAHIHLESTLLSPAEFARAVLPHGTTTVICDPHEIA
ncbi:MAG: adenine deaminase, partial [Clostridia bacterium]|nr:adenine deaminase [Clostridia bacterium]